VPQGSEWSSLHAPHLHPLPNWSPTGSWH
jgi:hypothetical protein